MDCGASDGSSYAEEGRCVEGEPGVVDAVSRLLCTRLQYLQSMLEIKTKFGIIIWGEMAYSSAFA